MTWRDDDENCKAAFVSIYGPEPGGRAFGGGVLIWDGLIITAAHVINEVLGRPADAPNTFTRQEPAVVRVGFPGTPGDPLRATVVGWVPRKPVKNLSPMREGVQTWAGDLALLSIEDAPPPGARPVRLAHHRLDSTVLAWYGSGESTTPVAARVVAEAGPWIVLDTTGSGRKLVPGYSGGPLWDRRRGSVVGLVIGVDGDRGYAMPFREIMKHLAGRQQLLGEVDTNLASSPAVEVLRSLLIKVLGQLDPARREDAERTARRLGCHQSLAGPDADAVEALVLAALGVQRGIATLVATMCGLVDDSALRQRLTAAATRIRAGELLSADEYGQLSRILARLGEGVFHRAVRRALPDNHQLPESRDPLVLLEFLERRLWTLGSVPSLVQAVEFVASGASEAEREALQMWAEQVTDRVGTAHGKLIERRGDAEQWEADRERSVRIQVRLERVDERTFRHRIWSQLGSDYYNVCTDDAPKTRAGILACLEGVMSREIPADAESVLLEFLVDEDDLDLDVDRWSIPGAVERMLGVEYEVVLRCIKPRLPFKKQWGQSWQRLGRDDPFVIGANLTSRSAVYAALKSADTGCVLVLPEGGNRKDLVISCVYAGIPVVLWPRYAMSNESRERLIGICGRDEQPVLPAHVHRLRVRAVVEAEAADIGGHLVLVWDDPTTRYPPVRDMYPPQEVEV
ncbi:hypothetical protein ABH935_006726 [Catenulispora sp. GAS73]|uniref:VMAP-C domain-containing protein n=1 Tax=Catenulispora sp. GAS73 TaxID=3156269 RepID=UPI003512E96F